MPNNPLMDHIRVDDPYEAYRIVPIHESPIVINWKGKIGYGDIVSPICYAHNIAEKNSSDVVLRFHWKQKDKKLYKQDDNEYIQDWVDYIANHTKPVHFWDVKIEHVYGSELGYNHDNYEDGNNDFMPIHNLRKSIHGWPSIDGVDLNKKRVCFVTSIKHKEQLYEYDTHKAWKDPMGKTPNGNSWTRAAQFFNKRGWEVSWVHYQTPLQECVKRLQSSNCVVGYHGAHTWLAKWMGLPMILFSKGGKLHGNITQRAFPWAQIYEYWTDFTIEHTEELIYKSIQERDKIYEEYKYWITGPNLYRLRSKRS